MNFYIQANNPKVLKEYNAEDKSIADAMETIFPLYTESAILMWNLEQQKQEGYIEYGGKLHGNITNGII